MAKKEEPVDSTSERVRALLIKLLKNILLLAGVVGLLYVGWSMIYRADPRQNHETVEQTVEAYTQLVQGFLASGAVLPTPSDVNYFLTFFDRPSRDFFEQNFEPLARKKLVLTPERFDQLGRDGRRGEAMLFIINYPPLNGILRVPEMRPASNNRQETVVIDRNQRSHRVTFVQSAGRWEMENFAGQMETIRERLN